ncbi:MAG: hypothetical protein A2Y17_02165 [Clostridiales bacterium GWF2_38_85]|nr:MAG: hypothetical protein A2Y17_02165 [Clostridiales bacterium GWF2_38_85]HBL85113.1 hypothetical protein [Clostridiales bacterium]
MKKELNRIKAENSDLKEKGIKYGAAYLPTENCIAVVIYKEENKNPVTGEYKLKKYSISEGMK